MKKSTYLSTFALFNWLLTGQFALGTPTSFNDHFIKQKEIHLSTNSLRIAYLWALAAGEDGRLYFLDARGCQLIVFDNDGRFISRIGSRGQGPGEFMVPRSVYIDGSSRIYVLDSRTRRINSYDSDGKFLHSFLLTNSHGPGNIVIDSHANLFLGGLSVTKSSAERGDWLQKYDSEGHFIRSFFKDISGKNWVFRMNPNFLFDIYEDKIYSMQIDSYDIQVFNDDGDLIKSFDHTPGYYHAPDEKYVFDEANFTSIDKLKEELNRLMKSWTRPINLETVNQGTLLVQCAANGFIKGSTKDYIIDLWSTDGGLIAEAIPCDYQFLCSDKKGNCYFLLSTNQEEALEKDPEYIIGKWRLSPHTK
jgi:hypothetical protein